MRFEHCGLLFFGFYPHFLKTDLRISDLGDTDGKIDLGQIRS